MASPQPMPAMPPPEGQRSNFVDPPYQGTKFLVVNCIFLPLAVIALVVRTWTRLFIVRNFRFDDYIMIIALILSIVMTAVTLEMLNWGLGRHMWDVPAIPDLSPWFMKLNMIAAIFYCAGTGFTKVSILIFYLRIFPSKAFHIAVWSIVFIAVGYNIASVLANVFACKPIAKSWDTLITGDCMNRNVFYFANAALNIFTDFATVLVPIPWLAKLQMPLRQKVATGLILATGCFVGIVSCIRLSTLYILMRSPDLTWATTDALMWCAIELNLGIVGGCVTAMRPFVRRYFPHLLGLSSNDGSYGNLHCSGAYSRGKNTYPLRSIPHNDYPNFTGTSNQYSTRLGGGVHSSDGDSEEQVLSEAAAPPGKDDSGIVRTVEFNVKSSISTR